MEPRCSQSGEEVEYIGIILSASCLPWGHCPLPMCAATVMLCLISRPKGLGTRDPNHYLCLCWSNGTLISSHSYPPTLWKMTLIATSHYLEVYYDCLANGKHYIKQMFPPLNCLLWNTGKQESFGSTGQWPYASDLPQFSLVCINWVMLVQEVRFGEMIKHFTNPVSKMTNNMVGTFQI